jgi:SHS2 domain-containing protein
MGRDPIGEEPASRTAHQPAHQPAHNTARQPARNIRGHRTVEHTADVIVEAWGPDRAACLEEAVAGLADTYLETHPPHRASVPVDLAAENDEAALLSLLDEVIFLLDTSPDIPVGVSIGAEGARVLLADRTLVVGTGSVPKAVSRHHLRLESDAGGMSCRFLVDV